MVECTKERPNKANTEKIVECTKERANEAKGKGKETANEAKEEAKGKGKETANEAKETANAVKERTPKMSEPTRLSVQQELERTDFLQQTGEKVVNIAQSAVDSVKSKLGIGGERNK
ncbi:late embryogenesis abundant protein, group 3-like [Pistacia vera]|uniref:late embryogenesis abundant protein, group 3-like n=1 Tax=Pistacia vera TaxID=55513 RepID=UPI0012632069|nr:late embryogenesis abundant protein, group 3-like [Pistacia vera]